MTTTLLEPLAIPEVTDTILSKVELQDLLQLRQTNRSGRTAADGRLRRMYFQIYHELSTDIPIGLVIRKLKEALYPPYRQGRSRFHVGDFGLPDGSGILEEFEDMDEEEREEYITRVIETDQKYKVGDYFFHYNFDYETRQYYGVAGVGYDIKTEKKIPIFDGEGDPEWPEWLKRQFKLVGTQLTYPRYDFE
jgi:hypothetical protein